VVAALARVSLEFTLMMPGFGRSQHLFITLAMPPSERAARLSGHWLGQSFLLLLLCTRGNDVCAAPSRFRPFLWCNWCVLAIFFLIFTFSPFFDELD